MNDEKQQKPDPTALAIDNLARALIANQPKGPLEMAGFSPERQKALTSPPPNKRYRIVPGKSPETEATFDMLVVESKTHAHGRVTEIRNYRHPAGIYKHESAGGIVPDGMPIFNAGHVGSMVVDGTEPPKHMLSTIFLQWRWEAFYQKDLRRIVGDGKRLSGAFAEHLCAEPSGFKTPWLTSESYVSADDMAAE